MTGSCWRGAVNTVKGGGDFPLSTHRMAAGGSSSRSDASVPAQEQEAFAVIQVSTDSGASTASQRPTYAATQTPMNCHRTGGPEQAHETFDPQTLLGQEAGQPQATTAPGVSAMANTGTVAEVGARVVDVPANTPSVAPHQRARLWRPPPSGGPPTPQDSRNSASPQERPSIGNRSLSQLSAPTTAFASDSLTPNNPHGYVQPPPFSKSALIIG